jgi:uncharacterized membrane protein YeaQ/YmgE (transglycosylase-associated protein family)
MIAVRPAEWYTVIVGFIIGYWGEHFLPGFFYNTLPLPVVGGVVAAVLYGAAARVWPRTLPAAGPSQPVVPAA